MSVRVTPPPVSVRPSDWTVYMSEARTSSALFLFMAIVALSWYKNGRRWPTQQRMLSLAVGAFLVAASAAVAPDFVTWLMVATFVIIALDSQAAVIDFIRKLQAGLGAPHRGTGPGAARPI